MTFTEIKDKLDSMLLVRALWWFIENVPPTHPLYLELRAYLNGRVRQHEETRP